MSGIILLLFHPYFISTLISILLPPAFFPLLPPFFFHLPLPCSLNLPSSSPLLSSPAFFHPMHANPTPHAPHLTPAPPFVPTTLHIFPNPPSSSHLSPIYKYLVLIYISPPLLPPSLCLSFCPSQTHLWTSFSFTHFSFLPPTLHYASPIIFPFVLFFLYPTPPHSIFIPPSDLHCLFLPFLLSGPPPDRKDQTKTLRYSFPSLQSVSLPSIFPPFLSFLLLHFSHFSSPVSFFLPISLLPTYVRTSPKL